MYIYTHSRTNIIINYLIEASGLQRSFALATLLQCSAYYFNIPAMLPDAATLPILLLQCSTMLLQCSCNALAMLLQ